MPNLRIHLFGSARLGVDGVPLAELGYPRQKVLGLLAYLLLHRGGPTPRARLAFLLRPESPEAEALADLRRTLHSLRRALPGREYLRADRQSVEWNTDSNYWLDVQAFEELLARGTPAALDQAVELYGGDLLEELYDDWLLPERERLRVRYLDALQGLVAHQRSRGQPDRAIATARRLLACDPLLEEAHRQVMTLLYLNGDRVGALRQYEQCRQILSHELGVEPLDDTRALRQLILNGEPLAEPAPPAPVSKVGQAAPFPLRPHPGPAGVAPPLVGREAEVARLLDRWAEAEAGRGWVVLIRGEAGIGKTRLMSELAERTRGRAFALAGGGHASERLLPYHPLVEALRGRGPALGDSLESGVPSPATAWWLAETARLLPELRERWPQLPAVEAGGDQLRLFEGLTRCVLALAARQPLLLVLDDLHWADEATLAWLEHLARQVRSNRALVVGTYRTEEQTPALEQLRLALARAEVLDELSLERLTADDVARLIREMTGSGGRALSFSKRLYRETEGNPLFLVETLRALFDAGVLRGDVRGWQADWQQAAAESAGLPLPATVREVIRGRLERLGGVARQVLEAAAVVGRQFDDRLVWQVSGRSEEESVAALEEALRGQLVAEREGGYRFTHDKIQEVVYAELSAARRRLLHRRVAEAIESRQSGRPEAAERLAYHFDRAEAWDKALPPARAAATRAKQLYAPAVALACFGLALTALAHLGDGAGGDGERRLRLAQRFDVLSERHGVWTLVGKLERARADLEQMVELARQLGDDARLSDALNGLGYLYANMGRPGEARSPLEEALTIKQRLGDLPGQADSLNILTTVYVTLGEVSLGLTASEQSRRLHETLGNTDGLARNEWMIGAAIYESLGWYERAIEHLQRSLVLSRELGNRALECGSLLMIGAASVRMGDYESGRAHLEQSLELARQIGDRPAEGWALLYLSWADREAGRFEASRARGRQALAIGREVGQDNLSWYALHSLARLHLAEGHPQDALGDAVQAYQISRGKTIWPGTHARSMALLARAHLALGHVEEARRNAAEALRELDSLHGQGVSEVQGVYFECYLALAAAGAAEALQALEQALAAMRAQAEAIADPERRAHFLGEVAMNREIVAAGQALD